MREGLCAASAAEVSAYITVTLVSFFRDGHLQPASPCGLPVQEAPSPMGSSSTRASPCGLPVLGAPDGRVNIFADIKALLIADFFQSTELLLGGDCQAAAADGVACEKGLGPAFFFLLHLLVGPRLSWLSACGCLAAVVTVSAVYCGHSQPTIG